MESDYQIHDLQKSLSNQQNSSNPSEKPTYIQIAVTEEAVIHG